MGVEMQRAQVWSTGSSYHMHECYHAGDQHEGKSAGLICDGMDGNYSHHKICKLAGGGGGGGGGGELSQNIDS